MQVDHRFVTLSQKDNGKQHLFTWRDDHGKFLCHAMYQSGSDALDIPGGTAPRGQILRILTKEILPSEEAALAPSRDAKTGTMRLQIDGKGWKPDDNAKLAQSVIGNGALNTEQKCAVICELAS